MGYYVDFYLSSEERWRTHAVMPGFDDALAIAENHEPTQTVRIVDSLTFAVVYPDEPSDIRKLTVDTVRFDGDITLADGHSLHVSGDATRWREPDYTTDDGTVIGLFTESAECRVMLY